MYYKKDVDTYTQFNAWSPKDNYENMPVLQVAVISNVWTKMMTFRKKGDYMLGHKHQFDHGTLLSSGSVELEVEGVKTVFVAPAIIFVEKDKIHNLIALEDNTVAVCIHALRNGDGVEDIIDPSMVPNGVDALSIFNNFGINSLVKK